MIVTSFQDIMNMTYYQLCNILTSICNIICLYMSDVVHFRFCCYDNPNPMNLTSETNEMAVIFKSNHPTKYERQRQGFKATLVASK